MRLILIALLFKIIFSLDAGGCGRYCGSFLLAVESSMWVINEITGCTDTATTRSWSDQWTIVVLNKDLVDRIIIVVVVVMLGKWMRHGCCVSDVRRTLL